MARPFGLSFKDVFYHITARGIRRENIFCSDRWKQQYLPKINPGIF